MRRRRRLARRFALVLANIGSGQVPAIAELILRSELTVRGIGEVCGV